MCGEGEGRGNEAEMPPFAGAEGGPKEGLRVSVELLQSSPASLSLLESAQSAAKTRLERGLLCSRTRKTPTRQREGSSGDAAGGRSANGSHAGASGSGHDMTYLLDGDSSVKDGVRGYGEDGEDNGEGASNEPQQPIKSQAVEPAPVLLLDAGDEAAWGLRDIPRGPVTWFTEPYVNVVMVACSDMEDQRKMRPRLKAMLDAEVESGQPMLIVHVIPPCTEAASRVQKRIYERFRDEAAVKRGVLCCRFVRSCASAQCVPLDVPLTRFTL